MPEFGAAHVPLRMSAIEQTSSSDEVLYGSTSVYVSELHPTHLRATAVGWFFGIGRIGSFLAPSVVGFMLAYVLGGWTLYTFALSYLMASVALLAVGVETKGRVLEEITTSETRLQS